jgi:hypothetical protein
VPDLTDLTDTQWAFEPAGWEALSVASPGPRAFHDRVLADDAIMIVPARCSIGRQRSSRGTACRRGPSMIGIGPDAATLTYVATARRDGQAEPYRAGMTSVYVRGASGWQLAIHQQTPLG